MELAIHFRNAEQADGLNRLQDHLSSIYENEHFAGIELGEDLTGSFTRIYIGDEFCPHRLPRLAELDALTEFAWDSQRQVTLLTPPLTDAGIEGLVPILDRLGERFPEAEVVANDWGVLSILKERCPRFSLSVGRLLDKGFKDPRLVDARALAAQSQEMQAVLNSSTFDSPVLQQKLVELEVERIERDMFPHRVSPPTSPGKLKTSIYFPYGYVTTGRVCWVSTFAENNESQFVPPTECSRPCNKVSVRLDHSDVTLPMFQSGNTVCFLQPPEALESMFEVIAREKMRVVYQGFAL
jgi:hypothetical protein